MQDQYVGDIGDFGKYGLLRHLTGMRDDDASGDALSLGVVWYRFPNEGKPDGRLTGYLCNPAAKYQRLRECDPELYDELRKIVCEKKDRRVVRVQKGEILPEGTLYYDRCLSYEQRPPGPFRESARKSWLEDSLEATKEAGLVFVDPDNGITEKPIQFRKNGPKYVFMEDLHRFYDRGQSLVVYHHLARADAKNQIKRFSGLLRVELGLPLDQPWALWYRRGTGRVYFIVPHKNHRDVLERRLQEFKNKSYWFKTQPDFPHPHFELVTPTED